MTISPYGQNNQHISYIAEVKRDLQKTGGEASISAVKPFLRLSI